MDDHKPIDLATAMQAVTKEGIDPEIASIKKILKQLDKAAKSARTYGAKNPVAQRFFQQFYDELSQHLATYSRLTFLVQRSALSCKEQIVYQQDSDATGESIAFKMYSDGIRELTFYEGLSQEDVSFFLDALWGTPPSDEDADDDDDLVTRLWSKNLSTISIVTAEEIVRSSGYGVDVLELQNSGFLSASPTTLRDLLDREQRAIMRGPGTGFGSESGEGGQGIGFGAGADGESGTGTVAGNTGSSLGPGGDVPPGSAVGGVAGTEAGAAQREGTGRSGGRPGGGFGARGQSSLIGYEVSEQELADLAKEIQAESHRDSTMYILDMLTAILASEQSPVLLSKLFDVWGGVLTALIKNGQWTVLESVLGLLYDTETVRPDLSDEHKHALSALFNGLGGPEPIALIESYLNQTPEANIDGLLTLLLMMKSEAVPYLCSLLAALKSPAHQAIVMEALFTLAKDQPGPIMKGLSDRRPTYVRNLLALILRWNDERYAEAVEKIIRYPDVPVRKEVLKVFCALRSSGDGSKIVSLVGDNDEGLRILALKALTSGLYTAPFTAWTSVVSTEDFQERPAAEKRVIFQAMRETAGDEAVPYWQELLTDRSWTNRKKKEDLAVIAAEALGKLATSSAIAALELGQRKGSSAVREACATALSAASRQPHRKIAAAG